MKKDKMGKSAEFKAALINKLKSAIGPMILLVIIVIGILVVTLYKDEEEVEKQIAISSHDEDFKSNFVLENDKLKFELDPTSTQFSIKVKDSGKVWYSNPVDAAEDAKALAMEKDKLLSTMYITYSTVNGIDALYSSYGYSVAKSIYDVQAGEDYIKVFFSFGDVAREYYIPTVIREEDFNALLANMEKSNALMLQDYYKKYDINNLGKKDKKEDVLEKFPAAADGVIYALRDTAKDTIKVKFEEWFANAGYSMDDYARDKALDGREMSTNKPIFNVNVIYRLDGEDLLVEVPLNEIEYKEAYPIYNITLLPFFGAGGASDEGFLFVPEGGGALINFNNGKLSQNSYYANVYGWDMCLDRKYIVHETESVFGTYGISCGDDSFLCFLEEGAAYAAIQADVSGKNNSYNYANAVYDIVHREQYDVSSKVNGKVFVYEPHLPDEKIVQRYRFMHSNNYVDMAKTYQGYLKEQYGEAFVKNTDAETPVVIEILGAVDKVKQILGVPVSKPLRLTSYKEAEEILRQLKEAGMNNMSVKMTGWANDGVKQTMLSKVKTVSELGSKKDLKSLISYANSNDIDIYLDGITDYAIDSNIFDGFNVISDAARFVSKEKAELREYRTVSYVQDKDGDPYYLLHSSLRMDMADNLVNFANKYQANVSFQSIGDVVSADYYRKNTVSRQANVKLQEDKLKEVSAAGTKVMINKGNDYALPYADVITNMDLNGSEYTLIDKFVPFYQLATHGYVNYTGEPLNLTQNTNDELLKSVEYGAGLSFTVMNETAFALQKTKYTEYFGAEFSSWNERMQSIYQRYNSELGNIFDQEMTNHEYVADNVTCTTYTDGTKVYVNYNYEDVKVSGGMTVPARDYAVSK